MAFASPSAVLFLEEDLRELQLEARSLSAIKSHEEIERVTVDERLTGLERAVHIMHAGTDDQELSVISSLPDLLKVDRGQCMDRVVPKVQDVLHMAPAEIQLAASSTFLQILQKEIVPIENYTQTFLQTILMSVDSRDPEVASAWLETLLDVIELLPKDVLRSDVLSLAVTKGQLAQSVHSRIACCKILGKIATQLDTFVIKHDILPIVQSLCQDVDYEVRACMCRQLDPVARGLGLDSTKSAILPELVELTCDESVAVRLAGLETVGSMISLLDSDTRAITIYPLVRNICDQALTSSDSTLPVVAKQLGKLCDGLSENLNGEQRLWLIDYFKELTVRGSNDSEYPDKSLESPVDIDNNITDTCKAENTISQCRENAAYNFPAIAVFAGRETFKHKLYESFSSLCSDPNINVRKNIASGFHEICKLVKDDIPGLQGDLITILKDDSTEVLKGIVSHLPDILAHICKTSSGSSTDTKNGNLSEIMSAIISCDQVIAASNKWRLQEELLDKMASVHCVFSSDHIYAKLVPLLMIKLDTSRALPVKHAAARTLLCLLRYNRRLEQREDIWSRLVYDFCQGKSCYQRYLFIDVCKMIIELYSKQFFKEYFFECLLELASDRVANVRLRVCRLLPALKSLLKLPVDRHLLQKLEACVRRVLINERDVDVEEAIRTAVEELDRTQVQMESLIKPPYPEDIKADIRKQEQEKRLLELEEKERKEDENKAKGSKKESKIPGVRKTSKIPAPTNKSSVLSVKGDSRRSSCGSATSVRSTSGSNSSVATKSSKLTLQKSTNNNSIGSPRLGRSAGAKASMIATLSSSASSASTASSSAGSGGKTPVKLTTTQPSPNAARRNSTPVSATHRRPGGDIPTPPTSAPKPEQHRTGRRPSQP